MEKEYGRELMEAIEKSDGNYNAEKIKEPPRPPARLEDYEAMSKEELIQELVRAKIVEARLKKGYEVKGAGAQKEFAPLDSKSTK